MDRHVVKFGDRLELAPGFFLGVERKRQGKGALAKGLPYVEDQGERFLLNRLAHKENFSNFVISAEHVRKSSETVVFCAWYIGDLEEWNKGRPKTMRSSRKLKRETENFFSTDEE